MQMTTMTDSLSHTLPQPQALDLGSGIHQTGGRESRRSLSKHVTAWRTERTHIQMVSHRMVWAEGLREHGRDTGGEQGCIAGLADGPFMYNGPAGTIFGLPRGSTE